MRYDVLKRIGLSSAELWSQEFWVPVAISLVAAIILIPTAVLATGGGHGRGLLLVASFPYVFILTSLLRHAGILGYVFGWAPILVLFAELPSYGVLLAMVSLRRISPAWILIAVGAHALAFALCSTVIDPGIRLY